MYSSFGVLNSLCGTLSLVVQALSGTIEARDADVERTGTYLQRVPERAWTTRRTMLNPET